MSEAPKRRWFRFSLRTLFVVVTVCCVWLGWQLHIVRERQAMLREFEKGAERTAAWDARILEAFTDSAVAMRQIAEFELGKDPAERDAEFMFRSAMRANELSGQDDADILQVVARVYCNLGMLDAAIASQEKAVAGASAERKETFQKIWFS